MITKTRLFSLLAATLALGACVGPAAWWDADLRAWKGASREELTNTWGPPTETVVRSGRPTMVYETVTIVDRREDTLLDPSSMVSSERPINEPSIDERRCRVYFELENDTVVKADYQGTGCEVRPRPGAS